MVKRLASLATVMVLGALVLAACGSEAAEEDAQDVTRVPVTYDAAAQATPEESAGAASPAGGATPSDGEAAAGDVQRGEELAAQCLSCHSVDGSALVGPTWQGLFGKTEELEGGETVVVDEAYLAESIRDPGAKIVAGFPPAMPAFDLSDQDVQDIIAYIKSLE
jgi:cytochrome c oxidase subunit 2